MPNISEDYKGWLQYQKQKWKIQRQARGRRRHLFGERRADATDAIGSMFRNQAEMLYSGTWQLLQLRPSEIPGEVKAFVLIDNKISTLKVVVPRRMFLNLKDDKLPEIDIKGCEVEKVNHTLPNGHPSIHLFKILMPERVFIEEADKLTALYNHPSVEGIYENQLPLHTKAVLELGNTCTFDESQRGVLGRGIEKGFDLSALHHIPSPQPYLSKTNIGHIYLYHVIAGERQIFALFSTMSNSAHVIVLNRSRDNQGLPGLDKLYGEAYDERFEAAGNQPWQDQFDYEHEMHFTTSTVTTRRKAILELSDHIKKIRNRDGGNLVLVLQSQQPHILTSDIPSFGDFPILTLKLEEADKQLPPLSWQAVVARRLVARYLDLGSWLGHLTELARYGNVPLCNLERDDPSFLIDLAYARRLQNENVVLWWSAGPRPDHAGYEKDDILGPLETVDMPAVNTPGTYSTVCIDVEVKNLLINTILTSSLVSDFEGSDSVSFNPGGGAVEGGNADGNLILQATNSFTSAGVRVLRDMVRHWHAEACSAGSGNSMADLMVSHLLRWVESPSSFLYDRSLYYYVQVMAKKAFQQLMLDCKRVGSHIVHASANRLLLQTTKAEVGNAYAYSQYILKTIKQKPTFLFLDLDVKEYWDYLIWYDEFNYGGVACQQVVETSGAEQQLDSIMHWQLCNFLPRTLQPVFHDWIVEFVSIMHARKRTPRESDSSTTDSAPRATQLPLAMFTSITSTSSDALAPTSMLKESFSPALRKQILALLRRQRTELLHPELASDHTFPVLAGSHLDPTKDLKDPVLHLVKSIIQVLSLDRSIGLEVRLLRKELLQLFDIREFAPEATFVNPSASCKVAGVICHECESIRDLDLCRDEPVSSDGRNSFSVATPASWACADCGSVYDSLGLQEQLVRDVMKLSLAWCSQDLKCGKCGRLRANEFMEYCVCAGEWVGTVDGGRVRRELGVVGRVARWAGFGMVERAVEEVGGVGVL